MRVFKRLVVAGFKYRFNLILRKIEKMAKQYGCGIGTFWFNIRALALAIHLNMINRNLSEINRCENEVNQLNRIVNYDESGILLLRKLLETARKVVQYETDLYDK